MDKTSGGDCTTLGNRTGAGWTLLANQRQCYESDFMFDFDDSCADRGVWRIGPVAAGTAITTITTIATVTAVAATTATIPRLSSGRGKTSSGFAIGNFAL